MPICDKRSTSGQHISIKTQRIIQATYNIHEVGHFFVQMSAGNVMHVRKGWTEKSNMQKLQQRFRNITSP